MANAPLDRHACAPVDFDSPGLSASAPDGGRFVINLPVYYASLGIAYS
jgi:hypothetical protein